jgi:photosystem II stability/assembly factor-like uncharacterized protein
MLLVLRRAVLFVLCLALFALPASAQEKTRDEALLEPLPLRNIGPANMGGRIVDLAVQESDPRVLYVAAATGGLWKSTDAGNSWLPVFDSQPTQSLGAVAIAPSKPEVIWVGTGEANARNSVSWGDGVYRSADGGKTWQHLGLRETHHIGRIAVHPINPDVAYVAALGHLWGKNRERGLFKTSDGGKSWQHVLALDDETGCVDVAIDPAEPAVVYACAYRVRRDGFSGGNPIIQLGGKAGLYRSVDAGKTWAKLTRGLPRGKYGRCGLSIYRKDPRVVFAVVQAEKTPVTVRGAAARAGTDPEVGGIFRSDDRGTTWKKLNDLCPRPFYYGQIRVDPSDEKRLYVLGVAFHVSSDGGRTFSSPRGGIHPDHHALWINPKDPNHLVLGNDGGLYFSQTRSRTWEAIRNLPVGQFYGIAVDMRKPYRVYGGLQDNGSWGGPSRTFRDEGIALNDWYRVAGADGFQCAVDPTDFNTIYAEGQYGMLWRVDLRKLVGGATRTRSPSIRPGGGGRPGAARTPSPYRFNWSSPLLLSTHDPRVLYYGANILFRSSNRGDKWERISPDLTRSKEGDRSQGHTLSAIAESPRKPGLLYAGSDDGRLHITRDDGKTWTDLSDRLPGVPANRCITRVECSYHDEATAYLAIGRHRNDDRKPYLLRTTDHGQTWTSVSSNLPEGAPLHVVRESSRNRNLLFAGTELGLFVSLDAGQKWTRVHKLPSVPVHDLVIHPRDRELVIGTHGRSIYVMDVAPLEELNDKVQVAKAHLFEVRPALAFEALKSQAPPAGKRYLAANPPYGAAIWYHLAAPTEAQFAIQDAAGKMVTAWKAPAGVGLQQVFWDLRTNGKDPQRVKPGEYTLTLQAAGLSLTRKVRVETAK